MTRYLLDTNHLSPLITIGHSLRSRVEQQVDKGNTFTVPTIVVSEFLFGTSNLPRAKQNQHEWQKLRSRLGYTELALELAEEAAILRLSLRKTGWQLKLIDALIAVTALRGDFTLLTMDKDFQSVPGLVQGNWRG